MNTKIDEDLGEKLLDKSTACYTVGSRKYGLSTEKSDHDYIVTSESDLIETGKKYQYTKDKFDYTIMNEETFLQKAISGDDLVCFEAYYSIGGRDFNIPKLVRAYSGIAYRDLKQAEKLNSVKKCYHAIRCQFIAEELLLSNKIDLRGCAQDAKSLADDFTLEESDSICARILRLRSILKGN
jgi:predicted nucleotidyltransferase